MQYGSEDEATCGTATALQKEKCYINFEAEKSRGSRSSSCTRRLVDSIESAREDERKRLARELHDDVGQHLLALRAQAYAFDFQFGENNLRINEATARMISAIDSTITVVRNLMSELREDPLAHGLVPALQWLAAECASHTRGTCDLRTQSLESLPSEEVAVCIFRIVQESLRNAIRHSSASEVSVQLEYNRGYFVVRVLDDGCGFVPDQVRPGALGLTGMRERASVLNGALSVTAAPGRGTSIVASIPAPARSQHPYAVGIDVPEKNRIEAGKS